MHHKTCKKDRFTNIIDTFYDIIAHCGRILDGGKNVKKNSISPRPMRLQAGPEHKPAESAKYDTLQK